MAARSRLRSIREPRKANHLNRRGTVSTRSPSLASFGPLLVPNRARADRSLSYTPRKRTRTRRPPFALALGTNPAAR
jgi:hypothetical protein